MTIETLEEERYLARQNREYERVVLLSDVIAKAREKETAGKRRITLTEQLVNDTLVEYRKMLKYSIAQKPEGNAVRASYEKQLEMLAEFMPPILEDEVQIENLITQTLYENNIEISCANKGNMMKVLKPVLRAQYVDMDIAMPIIESMIKQAEVAM